MLPGERDAGLLKGCKHLGAARTVTGYQLVDLGVYGAMIVGGTETVSGELFTVPRAQFFHLDVHRQVPILFQRQTIELENGERAESYVMTADQVRGKRRLHHGDWRGRFRPASRAASVLKYPARR